MKAKYLIFAASLLLLSCNPEEPDPEGTIYFTETEEQLANPERGFYVQEYYESTDMDKKLTLPAVESYRDLYQITLFLHSYYLTDYKECDIPQDFLDRLDRNMDTLREGGAKVILRFSYEHERGAKNKPWDATPEWALRHIEQLEPYLQKHGDVIYCVQAGFIGVWGEWHYTSNYPFSPTTDEGYEPRWPIVDRLMKAVPADRQICFRQPQFKMRYLRSHGMEATPLTVDEAYKQTTKARWAAHNDCFVSDDNDVGTYHNEEEREFWAEDTRFTLMGGETCKECDYSKGDNAIKEMAKYHWSYLCNSYHQDVLRNWKLDGYYDEIQRRLGYRFTLDKAFLTQAPKAGERFDAQLTLHNSGFANPINKRGLEMIFVSVSDPTQKYVYAQSEDPRLWFPGEKHKCTLSCTLDGKMHGEYKLYLNLPDPCESLHNDPRFSIRFANKDMWEAKTGYNYLTTVNIED